MGVLVLGRDILSVGTAIALLAACSGNGSKIAPFSSIGTQRYRAARTAFATRYPKLYVGWAAANQVGVYSYRAKTLLRTISQGIDEPIAFAFDSGGNVYIANYGDATVSVYASGGTSPIRTISGLHRPRALIFDSAGNLYVACEKNVQVYAPGGTSVLRTIETGIGGARALAFDGSGNLYVANAARGSVTVYGPGGDSPTETITDGIHLPSGLAFDGLGNLYVANERAGKPSGVGTVTVYGPGSIVASRTISTGVGFPDGLAFDAAGDLYVANLGNGVSVYAPGGDTPIRTVDSGISIVAVLLDRGGALYDANRVVHVWAEGGQKLLRTVSMTNTFAETIGLGP